MEIEPLSYETALRLQDALDWHFVAVPNRLESGLSVLSGRSFEAYNAILNLIASFGAWTRSCLVPR
jgi:hypothetical protein